MSVEVSKSFEWSWQSHLKKWSISPCWETKALTYLIMVDLHGGVAHCAKDGDDREFSDGHLTHRLQILVSLLDIYVVLFRRGCDQLHEEGVEVRGSSIGQNMQNRYDLLQSDIRTFLTEWPFHNRDVIRIGTSCKTETHSLSALNCAVCPLAGGRRGIHFRQMLQSW